MRVLLFTFTLLFGALTDDVIEDDGYIAEWRIFTQVCKHEKYVHTIYPTDIVFYFKDGTNTTRELRRGGVAYGMKRGQKLQTTIELPPLPHIRDVLLMTNRFEGDKSPDSGLPCIHWLVMVEPSMDLCHAFYFYKFINGTSEGGSFPAKKELDRPHADCIGDIIWKKEELKEE